MSASRREFLRTAGRLIGATGASSPMAASLSVSLAGLAALGSQPAHASDSSGYKAIVCLYMQGGNDAHNWVVPIDATGYGQYCSARGALALPPEALTRISLATSQGSGREFAIAAELAPLRDLYEAGRAAVVANVGTLVQPITRADYEAKRGVPPRLFSHNDQSSTWQALSLEGARSGWGGRMGDLFAASNAMPVFTAISTSGNAVFLSGSTVSQYQVGTTGPTAIRAANTNQWVMGSDAVNTTLRSILADNGATPFQAEYQAVIKRSMDAELMLRSDLAATTVLPIPHTTITLPNGSTTLDQDNLAQQLQMVARLVATGRNTLGMRRQVFMVSLGGFDTHASQLRDQASLNARIAHSVRYFYDAVNALGMASQVTLFTASDFGRTLTNNGDGSDHGWGSHHFVVGGAVKGRNIYGSFPVTALGGPNDIGAGRLLPAVSVAQYAATLGRWFGISDTELQTVLPGWTAFSPRTLGFL